MKRREVKSLRARARADFNGPEKSFISRRAARAAKPVPVVSSLLVRTNAALFHGSGPEMKGRFLLQLRRNRVPEVYRRGAPT